MKMEEGERVLLNHIWQLNEPVNGMKKDRIEFGGKTYLYTITDFEGQYGMVIEDMKSGVRKVYERDPETKDWNFSMQYGG